MKLKVLSSFLILLSFYIIYGAKLPDKISTTSVQPAAKRPPTKPTKPQVVDVNALAQQMTSTAGELLIILNLLRNNLGRYCGFHIYWE